MKFTNVLDAVKENITNFQIEAEKFLDDIVGKVKAYVDDVSTAMYHCDCSHCEDLRGNSAEPENNPEEGCICTCTLCPCCDDTTSGRTVCDGPCNCCEEDPS